MFSFKSAAAVLGLLSGLVALPSQANVVVLSASMSGLNENPANASPATGASLVTFDDVLNLMQVHVTFSGLTGGNASAAHIHCCIARPGNVGVAVGLVGFPLTTSGTYDHTFDLTLLATYASSFVNANGGTATSAEAALLAGLRGGNAYTNIHNSAFPGGEIRGFLTPEPTSYALVLLAMAGLAASRRKASSAK